MPIKQPDPPGPDASPEAFLEYAWFYARRGWREKAVAKRLVGAGCPEAIASEIAERLCKRHRSRVRKKGLGLTCGGAAMVACAYLIVMGWTWGIGANRLLLGFLFIGGVITFGRGLFMALTASRIET